MCSHNTSSSLELGAIFCDSVIHTSVLGGKQQIKKNKKQVKTKHSCESGPVQGLD